MLFTIVKCILCFFMFPTLLFNRFRYAQWHRDNCDGDVVVRESGLRVNPKFPFLGTSVDGLVDCTKCGQGVLEIKCPYRHKKTSYKNITPEECAKVSSFCCSLVDGKLKLKPNHSFIYQIMGQMAITERHWCDFVIYTKKGISVEHIIFDTEWEKIVLPKLQDFFEKVFVAEIFTHRVKRGVPLLPCTYEYTK